ncbi:MAG: GNAT family N-acetyltransferase [Candidatus Absconditicoccaceae bacterium]
MLKIIKAQKDDLLDLAKIYMKSYNAEGEKWTLAKSKDMINYRFTKKLKLKATLDGKIVGLLFSDIKPFYNGNILIDGDLVIDLKYQKQGIGKELFFYGMDYAHKNFGVRFREFYTFRDSYQYKRYKKLGFYDSEKFVLMAGNIEDILKNNKYFKNNK